MPVNSQNFIDFARDCVLRDDEIGFRNAVARAYYGAYHHVCPMMQNGPKESHQGLINYLKDQAWREGNEIYSKNYLIGLGHALQALKDQRIKSDYRIDLNIEKMDASIAVKTCEKLIIKCHEMVSVKAS
ncbi:hypothetical protein [Yersinia thracica]|uniref:hypothetical protein n=1 Tax=Yersinia thracica TaxID=2890319 RepID=UPI00157D01F1|nr:hypothetical protein [Yersinia thracica]